ncbi:MAG: hypothetical protein QNJ65_03445 [Xenococcaceae cyanobacterium MO_234.B1]|nr:hypothetical protein [Xenococcaceae cyanobacterium MO_234.B1]
MTRTNTETQAVSANFDALAFELKHSQDYEQSQQFYVETDYEIDSDSDWCGSLYRVWKNCCLSLFREKTPTSRGGTGLLNAWETTSRLPLMNHGQGLRITKMS